MTNRSIPSCTVIPEIPYPDVVEAATWLCDHFGFTLRLRIANHRVQLNVGAGAMVVTEQRTATGPGSCSVMVRVENVDEHYAHATQLGTRVLSPPVDYPYGERQYTAEDLAGNRWTFSQSIADVDPASWGGIPGKI